MRLHRCYFGVSSFAWDGAAGACSSTTAETPVRGGRNRFTCSRDFALYVFEGVASVGMEIRVSECPAVFAKLGVIGCFYLI